MSTNLPSKNKKVTVSSTLQLSLHHTLGFTRESQRGCDSAISLSKDRFQPSGGLNHTPLQTHPTMAHRKNHKHLAVITQGQIQGQVWRHERSARRQALRYCILRGYTGWEGYYILTIVTCVGEVVLIIFNFVKLMRKMQPDHQETNVGIVSFCKPGKSKRRYIKTTNISLYHACRNVQ